MKLLISIVLFLFCFFQPARSQNSYQVMFSSDLDDVVGDISKGYNGEYTAIKFKSYWGGIYDTAKVTEYNIYSFYNNLQDSLRWPIEFNRNDTNIFPQRVYFDSMYYYVFGAAVMDTGQQEEFLARYQYMAKFDINKQIVWERFYERPPELLDFWSAGIARVLLLTTGNFLTVAIAPKLEDPTTEQWLLREFSKNGDVIKTRLFSNYLTGYIQSLTYSFDSSEILIHSTTGHIPGCNHLNSGGIGALVLDTATYDTVGGICYYPDIKIEYPYEAKFDRNGQLILSGETMIFDFDHHKFDEYIGTYVLNSNFQVVNSKFLTDKDRKTWAGENTSMDISPEGDIYVAGVVDWVPDFWPTSYDYIYVAKMDSNLNLLTERYFGGDSFYSLISMMVTSDGGVVLGGIQYDYKVNNYEHDAFFIKTDADLMVGIPALNTIPVHMALVYPNPGNGTLKIRTTEKGSLFRLYNLSGKLLLQTEIKNLVTQQDASRLANGVYVWKLVKNNREIDRGKWINIK